MAMVVPEKTQKAIDHLAAWAVAVQVNNDEEKIAVLEIVKGAKEQRKVLDSIFDPNIKRLHDAHKASIAEKKAFTDRLDKAERAGKQAVLRYDQEQERLRLAEQRRLQAEADEKARRERERLEKEALKLKTPELQEQRLAEAQAIEAPVIQVQGPVKVEGVVTRKTWKARVTDINLVPREYMVVNETALNGLARATKGSITIPGVEFYEESTLAL